MPTAPTRTPDRPSCVRRMIPGGGHRKLCEDTGLAPSARPRFCCIVSTRRGPERSLFCLAQTVRRRSAVPDARAFCPKTRTLVLMKSVCKRFLTSWCSAVPQVVIRHMIPAHLLLLARSLIPVNKIRGRGLPWREHRAVLGRHRGHALPSSRDTRDRPRRRSALLGEFRNAPLMASPFGQRNRTRLHSSSTRLQQSSGTVARGNKRTTRSSGLSTRAHGHTQPPRTSSSRLQPA